MKIKQKLIILNFLQFAVWGAYLTSMGGYLAKIGMGSHIGWFYSMQGLVSLFMPALMGIVADRWIQAQKLLSLCHALAGLFMCMACGYGYLFESQVSFFTLFTIYSLSVAFYMPTIALSNSVAYSALEGEGLDTVKAFPPIRVFGTIGFIISMWLVDLLKIQYTALQFGWSGILGLVLALYALTMPPCEIATGEDRKQKTFAEALGLDAFKLFKSYKMAVFFIFSMLLGVCLQITNGFANPFISSFQNIAEFANTFGVQHANILISLSQISETLCILLIPFFLSKLGIKKVMLISILAWVLRFAFFAIGDPGDKLIFFILSMIVYGVAFDFFNISGSLFVDKETDISIRNSAQGLFMMMTNGLGATIGTIAAQQVINHYVYDLPSTATPQQIWDGWQTCWIIFAVYSLVIAILFSIFFRYKNEPQQQH